MKDIEDFLYSLKDINSNSSIESYKYDLKDFIKYIDLKIDCKDLKRLEIAELQELINNYMRSLKDRGLKPKTINRKVISVNKFMKYLDLECRAKGLRVQKKLFLNNTLSNSDINKMLRVCENSRDRAIIITLYGSGLRVSELLKITVKDINKKTILIQGKRGKYREIILPIKVRKALKEYLEVRPKSDISQLFIGTKGALKRQAINKIIKKYSRKAKVKLDKAHPHSFRHLFCKNLAEQGIGIDIIASLAGHENIETTSIYTKRTESELQNVLDRTFNI
jgi:integrase/recombinase XerD